VYSDTNVVNSANSRFIPTRLTDISDRDEERTSGSSVNSIHNSGTKQRPWLREAISRKLDGGKSLDDNCVKMMTSLIGELLLDPRPKKVTRPTETRITRSICQFWQYRIKCQFLRWFVRPICNRDLQLLLLQHPEDKISSL
jgi:hypothetical protein